MNGSRLRLRATLDSRFTALVAVLLVLGLVGAGVAYGTHVDPTMESQEQVVSSWAVTTNHTHSATVTEENSVFPEGTELTDRSTYFTSVAPELDGEVFVEYTAASADDVTVAIDVALVMESADEETTYWREQRPLASIEQDAGPDEPVSVPFTLNASAVEDRISEIESDLGSTPGETAIFIRTDVALEGVVDGDQTGYSRTLNLPLSIAGDTYTVGEAGPPVDTIERTETVQTTQSYGPLRTLGAPLLLIGSIVALGGLVGARRRGWIELDDAERAYLDYRDDRTEFDEWITQIRLPAKAFDRPEATATSLSDLVDYAIDNDRGVVKDPETGRFHVSADQYLYTYTPPATPDGEETPAQANDSTETPSTATDKDVPGTEPNVTGDSDTDADEEATRTHADEDTVVNGKGSVDSSEPVEPTDE